MKTFISPITGKEIDDLRGEVYGDLTVLELDIEKSKENHKQYWRCLCKCGNTGSYIKAKLKSGHTKSCGCRKNKKWDSDKLKGRKWNLETVSKFLSEKGFKILDDEFYMEKKVNFVDRDGYKYSMLFSGIINENKPHRFRQGNDYVIHNLNLWTELENKRFKLISTKFVSQKDKLIWECQKHGVFERSIQSITRENSHGCQKCAVEKVAEKNRYTIDKIIEIIKENNIKWRLLSTEYINSSENMRWECPIHGEFLMPWEQIQQGHGCQKCAREEISNSKRYTIEEVKQYLKNINYPYKLLSEEYIDSRTPLEFECEEHGRFYKPFGQITVNGIKAGCQECGRIRSADSKRITEEEVIERLNRINFKHTYIKGTWEGVKTPFRAICDKHGEFTTYLSTVEYGSNGCPKCSLENRSGENAYNWKGGITPLHNHLRSNIEQWKLDSFRKYDFKCDITGNPSNNIIHHLVGFGLILKETIDEIGCPIYDTINKYTEKELETIREVCLRKHYEYGLGVCLCEEMHKEFHNIYGYGNNTPEQYYEFRNNKLKEQELKSAC